MSHAVLGLVTGIALLAIGAHAAESSLKNTLRSRWLDKDITLRVPDASDNLVFDAQGNRVGTLSPGPWFENSSLHITNVSVNGSTVELRSKRSSIIFDPRMGKFARVPLLVLEPKKRKWVQAPLDHDVVVRFEFAKAPTEVTDVLPAFEKVFFPANEELRHMLPEYWSDCARGMAPGRQNGRLMCSAKTGGPEQQPTTGTSGDRIASEMVTRADVPNTVFRVGGAVKPPRVIDSPDPAYSEIARKEKYQGTTILWLIVDKDGLPRNIRVAVPLGMGLDDKAAEAVQSWRFQPATRDGAPVAVQINVEVNFRLY